MGNGTKRLYQSRSACRELVLSGGPLAGPVPDFCSRTGLGSGLGWTWLDRDNLRRTVASLVSNWEGASAYQHDSEQALGAL